MCHVRLVRDAVVPGLLGGDEGAVTAALHVGHVSEGYGLSAVGLNQAEKSRLREVDRAQLVQSQ